MSEGAPMGEDDYARGRTDAQIESLVEWREDAKKTLSDVPLIRQRLSLIYSVLAALGAGVLGLAVKVAAGGLAP